MPTCMYVCFACNCHFVLSLWPAVITTALVIGSAAYNYAYLSLLAELAVATVAILVDVNCTKTTTRHSIQHAMKLPLIAAFNWQADNSRSSARWEAQTNKVCMLSLHTYTYKYMSPFDSGNCCLHPSAVWSRLIGNVGLSWVENSVQ